MRIARIQIKNFRNFESIDVLLRQNAVILGENKIGKSNLLFALRLVLDASLPDSVRQLREEDFWDQLPMDGTESIEISVDLTISPRTRTNWQYLPTTWFKPTL